MPRNYSRKTNRQGWDKTSMEKAIEAVKKNEMGWLRASKVFNVSQSTLRRHALKQNRVLAPSTKGKWIILLNICHFDSIIRAD